jgi:hypothetical protein
MRIFAFGRTGALDVWGADCSGCVKDILGVVGGCYIMYIVLLNTAAMLLNHKNMSYWYQEGQVMVICATVHILLLSPGGHVLGVQ